MGLFKSSICLLLFLGALAGALWPVFREGQFDWRYDMDVRGGVHIVYRADFASLHPEQRTPAEKLRLMELSHLRLDSRLANFQGADVRVQILGKDRLLVEIPGIRDIAQVKLDLGKPRVVSFARVASLSLTKDVEHRRSWKLSGLGQIWLRTDKPVIFGGNIHYAEMEIAPLAGSQPRPGAPGGRYRLSLPLDEDGRSKMAALTTAAYDDPAELIHRGKPERIPLMALFLDQDLQDVFVVGSANIRHGAISVPTADDAQRLKRLLASGPMPLKFDLYSERSVAPLTGATFRDKGLLALVASLALLVLVMCVSYPGRPWFWFVYAATLAFWFLCLLTLVNLHLIRISMIQLAAFVLLLGMNTDSLVLVFEDLRQEFEGEARFRMSFVGEAFGKEWKVVFWGMATTMAVILPLALQRGVFTDYVTLLAMGMGLNVLGFFFARLLMSLPVAEELSRMKFAVNGLADWVSRLDLTRFPYLPLGLFLALLASVAVFIYPTIPLSPVFGGGKALELTFAEAVPVAAVERHLATVAGRRSEILTDDQEGMTEWVFVKFPPDVEVVESEIVRDLQSATGVEAKMVSVETISGTLMAKTRLSTSAASLLGFLLLAILSVYIYNLVAGFCVGLAVAHDLLICLGCMAVFGIGLDLPAIAAIATVVGYSVNDSIVILHKLKMMKFERRVTVAHSPGEDSGYHGPAQAPDMRFWARRLFGWPPESVQARNIRRMPARILITSATTALPMAVLAIVAGGIFRDYALIVLAGVVFGTLSSIYIVGRVDPEHGFVKWGDS